MRKICLFTVLFVSWMTSLFPQTPTQVIRGKITDAETKIALPGTNIVLMFSDPLKGATSNAAGTFTIEKVPVGRHSLKVSYVGYKPAIIPEILVTSGKECIVNVELENLVVMSGEVEIKATVNKDKPINPMAMGMLVVPTLNLLLNDATAPGIKKPISTPRAMARKIHTVK